MPTKESQLDKFLQFAVGRISMTAAADNTVVSKLETGITNMQKVAWECFRIEYELLGGWTVSSLLTAGSQYISMGWTQNSDPANVPYGVSSASVIDSHRIYKLQTPAAVGELVHLLPYTKTFAEPILVLPQTLYMFLDWALAAAGSAAYFVASRLWYREREITSADWYDLLQLRLPLGVIA